MIRRLLSARSLITSGLCLIVAGLGGATLAGCSAQASEPGQSGTQQPITSAMLTGAPDMHLTFRYDGDVQQGGWIRGQVPDGTVSASFDGKPLAFATDGVFFASFDRDAGSEATLTATLKDGREVSETLNVAPREWQIERVNVARRSGGPSVAFMKRRQPELDQIWAARAIESDTDGWRQDFIWPVRGRIPGRFGSQRIYRGEPGSYHTGLDIATGESGTPFVAPADGVVILAAKTPFSLEGHLLMIDHGMGLNSAFLHCSDIAVELGETVKQGQYIGNIGSSGRATGPHLHWSMKWHDARVDPLLFVGEPG